MCGDVRFKYRGDLIETGHCHCESCRRHTSAPLVTFMVMDKTAFRYTHAAPVAYEFLISAPPGTAASRMKQALPDGSANG